MHRHAFLTDGLGARIEAALRRPAGPEPYVLGWLAKECDRCRVSVAGRAAELTPTETTWTCESPLRTTRLPSPGIPLFHRKPGGLP